MEETSKITEKKKSEEDKSEWQLLHIVSELKMSVELEISVCVWQITCSDLSKLSCFLSQ